MLEMPFCQRRNSRLPKGLPRTMRPCWAGGSAQLPVQQGVRAQLRAQPPPAPAVPPRPRSKPWSCQGGLEHLPACQELPEQCVTRGPSFPGYS